MPTVEEMNKAKARKIAINYLYNAACSFTDISVKYPIDDSGTLSEQGYTYEECEVIQKELDFLLNKILPLELKSKPA